jgi:integrase
MEMHHVAPCCRHFGGMVGGITAIFGQNRKKSCPQMPLNSLQIRAFRGGDAPYKKTDECGLYLEVFPNDSKLWRFKYRAGGKDKRIALGAWPELSLADARRMRDELRLRVADGEDPALSRKKEKATAKLSAANTFEAVALEYIESKMAPEQKAEATLRKARWFVELLRPAVGCMPITDVDPQMMLAALKKLEAKGNHETAKKCRSFASRVFRYGAATGRCSVDPTAILKGALVTPKARHYAAIIEPKRFGDLLRAIESYDGHVVTKYALLIAPHVFLRPGELRHGEWHEIDWDASIWTVSAGKMKSRRPHAVPLSRPVVGYLQELQAINPSEGFIFPSFFSTRRPMSENTLNVAFRRMGFGRDEITAHGLRSTASTLLNESGLWHPDAIERALAHGDSNAIRGIYNRGNYWAERVKMAQWWSDHIDALRDGGKVEFLPRKAAANG